jgi:hypothetical protein
MPGRRIADEHDARACLEAVAGSGLTRRERAHAHGIDARSLNAWRLNLERRAAADETAPLRLVELVAREEQATSPASVASGVRLEVGGLVIQLDRGFDSGVLLKVLDLVAPCRVRGPPPASSWALTQSTCAGPSTPWPGTSDDSTETRSMATSTCS